MIRLTETQRIWLLTYTLLMFLPFASSCANSQRSNSSKKELLSKKKPAQQPVVRNSVPEWYAFAVFHPESSLSEDDTSIDAKQSSSHAIEESQSIAAEKKRNVFRLTLGAKSLLPILRATFGNQARSSADGDENTWFTTHPSDLFTPSELSALCHSSKISDLESMNEYCWKPQVTQQYLVALSNFASDACIKLVEAESKNEALQSNKILRNKAFSESDLKNFAIRFLKIDTNDVTDEWVNKIMTDANKFLQEELQLEPPETEAAVKVHSIEKAIFSCRAALTSEEFYSR